MPNILKDFRKSSIASYVFPEAESLEIEEPGERLESIATVKYLFEHAHINQMIRVNRSSWCNNVKVKKMPMYSTSDHDK